MDARRLTRHGAMVTGPMPGRFNSRPWPPPGSSSVNADLAQRGPSSGEIARHHWLSQLPLQQCDHRQTVELVREIEDHVGFRAYGTRCSTRETASAGSSRHQSWHPSRTQTADAGDREAAILQKSTLDRGLDLFSRVSQCAKAR